MSTTTAPPLENPLPLRQRVIAASLWSLSGYAVSLIIRFGGNLVMTRLMMPKMYGVMAIASIVIVGLAMFSDLGLGPSITQSRRGSDPAFLNTAWTLQILRGIALSAMAIAVALGLYVAVHVGAVSAGSVYADPILPWVIIVLSFDAMISGFGSTKALEANRNLALGRMTQMGLVAQIAGLAAMLAWAAVDRSVWALVAGSVTSTIVSAVTSHLWLPGTTNRWHWDRTAVTELLHFGKWIFASSILGFVVNNSDRLLLGGMTDASTFGVAAIAFLLVGVVDQVMGQITGNIALSALSEVVRKGGDLRVAYYRLHTPIAALSYFSVGFLITAGQSLVAILYDHRYADAGWMLQILSIGLFMAPAHVATQCYIALGKPHRFVASIIVRLVAIYVLVPAGYNIYGFTGAIWGILLSQLSYLPVILLYNRRYNFLDIKREAMPLPMFFVGALAATLGLMAIGIFK